MLQATLLYREIFDLFLFQHNVLSPSIAYISRNEIVQALMHAFVVVVLDED